MQRIVNKFGRIVLLYLIERVNIAPVKEKKFDLSSLVVSQETIATDEIAGALHGLVTIVQETGEVLTAPAFDNLSNNSKIIAYLLALRASAMLGFGNKKVAADADEIATFLGIEGQSTREYLSRLKGKLLQKTAEGWQLSAPRIPSACAELTKKRK